MSSTGVAVITVIFKTMLRIEVFKANEENEIVCHTYGIVSDTNGFLINFPP